LRNPLRDREPQKPAPYRLGAADFERELPREGIDAAHDRVRMEDDARVAATGALPSALVPTGAPIAPPDNTES
jgi:hypothetical protein